MRRHSLLASHLLCALRPSTHCVRPLAMTIGATPAPPLDPWGVIRTVHGGVLAGAVVNNLLLSLQKNNFPETDSGIRCFWDWTHDLFRGDPVNGHGNFTKFRLRARNSELEMLIDSEGWTLMPFSPVGDGSKYGSQVAVVSPRGDLDAQNTRRFLFQLRREDRPPYNGGWSVWAFIVSTSGGDFRSMGGKGGI